MNKTVKVDRVVLDPPGQVFKIMVIQGSQQYKVDMVSEQIREVKGHNLEEVMQEVILVLEDLTMSQ
jgi:hypothetical protein